MGAMTMNELEAKFAEMFETKMAKEREAVAAQLKSAGADEAKIKEAVDARVKELQIDEAKRKAAREDMMSVFEAANVAAANRGEATVDGKKMFGRMVAAGLKAMEDSKAVNIKSVNKERIADTYKKMFGADVAGHSILTKELNAGTPSAGGFTIPPILLPDVIEYLYANTILDKLGVQKVPMPNGNFSLPRMDTTSSVGWVGETASIGTDTAPVFGEVNLRAKKLKAMTAVSNTLLRQNIVGLDAWVSRDLQRVARIALDSAFLYGAGTEYTPRGLSNTTGIQTSGSSSTAIGLTTPIDLVALLEQSNVPMDDVKWILSPMGKSWLKSKAFSSGPFAWADEMNRNNTLNGFDFVTSATVNYSTAGNTSSDFWIMDVAQILWGVSYDLSLEMSREGTYTSGGSTVSAFDQDLTLIRIIGEHDFGVRQPKAVVQGTFSKS